MVFELDRVFVQFGSGVPSLSNVSMKVPAGTINLVIGPTGAGKTTLLRLLYRGLIPSEGDIIFKGQSFSSIRKKRIRLLRQIIGIIFQEPRLINNLTCFENIKLPLILNGIKQRKANEMLLGIMAELGINYLRTKMPDELSVGEKKLVAAARALVHSPEIIIADEVSENLDDKSRTTIYHKFRVANKMGTTIIMASADALIRSIFPNANVFELNEGVLL